MKRKHLLSSLLLGILLAVPPLAAQEFTRSVQYVKDDHSIARELNSTKWIVGNNYMNEAYFTHIDATGSTCQVLHNILTHLSDMEILDSKYVFFCGSKMGDPIFGFFEGGTSNPLGMYCSNIKQDLGIIELKKMAIYPLGGKVHLAMTAKKVNGVDCIVDAIVDYPPNFATSPSCTIYIGHDMFFTDVMFDDIDVTEKYVAATARRNNGGIIYVFEKTSAFLTSVHNAYSYSYFIDDTLLVASAPNDIISTCTKKQGTATVTLSSIGLTAGSHIGTCCINHTTPWDRLWLRDITYNNDYCHLSILTNDTTINTSHAITIKIPSDLSGGTASVHTYNKAILSSIRPCSYTYNAFVVSGHEAPGTKTLRLSFFQRTIWQNCTEKTTFTLTPTNNDIREYPHHFYTPCYGHPLLVSNNSCYIQPVVNTCQ